MDIRRLCSDLTDGQLNGLLILIGINLAEHKQECEACRSRDPLTRYLCDDSYTLKIQRGYITRALSHRVKTRVRSMST